MSYDAKILADSISPARHRLTSIELTLPRIVLAELNTHRVFSRNSASSRAIPVATMLERVREDAFSPLFWGKTQKGMVADEELADEEKALAETFWLEGRDAVVAVVQKLLGVGLHKQIANRLLEPFLFHTVIITASEWANAFNLRRDKNAQPEIRMPFEMMFDLYDNSIPDEIDYGQWHLPLVRGRDMEDLLAEGYKTIELAQISCGRCGRVSYLTHDGKRDPKADIAMTVEKLVPNGHMSPTEHAARPMYPEELALFTQPAYQPVEIDGETRLVYNPDPSQSRHFCGNIEGWIQLRKLVSSEAVFQKMQR